MRLVSEDNITAAPVKFGEVALCIEVAIFCTADKILEFGCRLN